MGSYLDDQVKKIELRKRAERAEARVETLEKLLFIVANERPVSQSCQTEILRVLGSAPSASPAVEPSIDRGTHLETADGRYNLPKPGGSSDGISHTCPWSSPGFFPNCNACVVEMQASMSKMSKFGRNGPIGGCTNEAPKHSDRALAEAHQAGIRVGRAEVRTDYALPPIGRFDVDVEAYKHIDRFKNATSVWDEREALRELMVRAWNGGKLYEQERSRPETPISPVLTALDLGVGDEVTVTKRGIVERIGTAWPLGSRPKGPDDLVLVRDLENDLSSGGVKVLGDARWCRPEALSKVSPTGSEDPR